MNRNKAKLILLISILFISFSIYFMVKAVDWNQRCIRSFHTFAYGGPPSRVLYDSSEGIPPHIPWQAEKSTNELPQNNGSLRLYRTALARTVDGNPEIWISLVDGNMSAFGVLLPQSSEGREGFAIYQPQTAEWELVSDKVGDTELYVVNLHADSSGTIWGETYWSWFSDYPEIETVPVLSRFNERTRRFEFAEGVLEIPLVESSSYFNNTQIVLDAQDIFWIFTDTGKIYRYDPVAQTTDLQADTLYGQVIYTTLSPDGSIYFAFHNYVRGELSLREMLLFRFLPDTGEVMRVDFPAHIEDWPMFAGLLVDRSGQLWLGAIGYRSLSEEWNLIEPAYLNTYTDHYGQYMYAAPAVMFESSDGRLWFRKYLDAGGWGEGTAWYDPETQQGCLFTNVATNIVEDSQQRLWLVVDGTLYSHQLNQ